MESFTTRPDPFVFLLVVFPASLSALALGYWITVRYHKDDSDKAEGTFGLGQGAIFGLIALILGFSFSFAADRFEARRALVVSEASAIGATSLRSDFLPEAQTHPFRKLLHTYTEQRLHTYALVADSHTADGVERAAVEESVKLQDQLWEMAASASKSSPGNLALNSLAASVNDLIDVAEQQSAALNTHVPSAIIGIVLLCTIVGAALLGLTFGRAKTPHIPLSIIFCVLFASTVFTIIDLDNAQGGLIHLNVRPLEATLRDMKP